MSTLHKRGRLAAAPIRTLCRLDPERTSLDRPGTGLLTPPQEVRALRGPPAFVREATQAAAPEPERRRRAACPRTSAWQATGHSFRTTSINGRARDS